MRVAEEPPREPCALVDPWSLNQLAAEQLAEAAVEPLLAERLSSRFDRLRVNMVAVVGIDRARHGLE